MTEHTALLSGNQAGYGAQQPPPPPHNGGYYSSSEEEEDDDVGIIDYTTMPWWKKIYYRAKSWVSSSHEEEPLVALNPNNGDDKTVRDSIKTACMLIVAILAAGVALSYLAFIFVPLALARFFVYLFQPLINYLVGKKRVFGIRLRMPRIIAVLIVIIIVTVLLMALCIAIYFSVLSIIHEGDKYVNRFNELSELILSWANELGFDEETVKSWLPEISVSEIMIELVATLYELTPHTVLCLLFTIYMLLDYDESRIKSRLQREVDRRVRTYIIIKVFVSVLTGVLFGAVLMVFTVPMFFMFGLLAFLLNFIPNIGSMIAVILPMPVVVFDPDQTWLTIVLIFVGISLIEFIIGNLLEPMLYGRSLDMSAVSVLVALGFWGYVWGIVGAFISVPITVMIQMWLRTVSHPMAQFLADLLSGRFTLFDSAEDRAAANQPKKAR